MAGRRSDAGQHLGRGVTAITVIESSIPRSKEIRFSFSFV